MKPIGADSSFAQLTSTPQGRRLFEQEFLLLSATELICELMDEKNVSRAGLAARIGKSKAFVTQVLNGKHNMTLRTLADLVWAMDSRVQLQHNGMNVSRSTAHRSLLRPNWISHETELRKIVRSEWNPSQGEILEVAA